MSSFRACFSSSRRSCHRPSWTIATTRTTTSTWRTIHLGVRAKRQLTPRRLGGGPAPAESGHHGPMRIGLNGSSLIATGAPLGRIADHAAEAESAGFSSYWLAQLGAPDAL